MDWAVTFFRGGDKFTLMGTESYGVKRLAVNALLKFGKPTRITRTRRSYVVTLSSR